MNSLAWIYSKGLCARDFSSSKNAGLTRIKAIGESYRVALHCIPLRDCISCVLFTFRGKRGFSREGSLLPCLIACICCCRCLTIALLLCYSAASFLALLYCFIKRPCSTHGSARREKKSFWAARSNFRANKEPSLSDPRFIPPQTSPVKPRMKTRSR